MIVTLLRATHCVSREEEGTLPTEEADFEENQGRSLQLSWWTSPSAALEMLGTSRLREESHGQLYQG